MGKRAGLSGPTNLAFLIWLEEVAFRMPALVVHECTPHFPPSLLKDGVPSIYDITSVILGPDHVGVPVCRDRILTVAVHKGKAHLDKDMGAFLQTIGVQLMMNGGAFWVAEHQLVQQELLRRADRQCLLPSAAGGSLAWEGTSPVPRRSGLISTAPWWRRSAAWPGRMPMMTHKPVISVSSRARTRLFSTWSRIPPIIRAKAAKCFWNDSVSVRRLMVKEEILSVAGVPSLPNHKAPYACPLGSMMPMLSVSQVTSLVGNSMHINIIGSLMMWLMASCTFLEKPSPTRDCKLGSSGSACVEEDAESVSDTLSVMGPGCGVLGRAAHDAPALRRQCTVLRVSNAPPPPP